MTLTQPALLHIKLLGPFCLEYGEKPLLAIDSARLQSLFAYLLLHRHTPLSRQQLAFLFWPDASETQAFTNLRNLIFKLRHALPNPDCFLFADGHNLQWRSNAPFVLDVAEFEHAAAHATAEAELTQAITLYSGDLLLGCYDDWIYPLRDRYQQMFRSLLEKVIDIYEQRRDYRTAIKYSQQLLKIDPLNEASVRLLMCLHAEADDRASALRVYHDCEQVLQGELEVGPDIATTELYRRLLQMERVEPRLEQVRQVSWPLVGRHVEWRLLQEIWTNKGMPQLLLLAGEAGIGKTRLAEELVEWVTRQGFLAASTHCYAGEGELPYAPIVSLLRAAPFRHQLATLDPPWIGELSRLLPELLNDYPQIAAPNPLTTPWQRQRLFEALARAMLNTKKSPLLFVDDLQWADRDTIEWLHYLLRFARDESLQDPKRPHLLLVGTVRSEEVEANPALSTLLLTLRHEGQLTEVNLGPLLINETTELATALTGITLSSAESEQLYRESEGNPLFVVEMIRASNGSHLPQSKEQSKEQHPFMLSQPLPPKVHAVIQARLAQLSPSARKLAGVAATIGRAFGFEVLAKASVQLQTGLIQSLDELWQHRIVRERGVDSYDFAHDKLREVTYNSLSAAHRHLLHRCVAEAMVALYASQNSTTPPGRLDTAHRQIATHFEMAGLFENAVPHYLQAAEDAQRLYANVEAINCYRHALALLEGPIAGVSTQIANLGETLGDLLSLTSQYEEARTHYLRAMTQHKLLERIDRARLQRKIGNTWREQYEYQQARQAYQSAESLLHEFAYEVIKPSETWWQEWIQLQLEIDLVHYWLAEIDDSSALQTRIEPLIEAHGTLAQQAAFSQRRGQLEFRRNRSVASDAALHYVKRSLDLYKAAGMEGNIPSAYFMIGFIQLWHDEPDAAVGALQQALQRAEASGDISLQARSLAYLAIAQRRRDDLEKAEAFAVRTLDMATTAHMPEYVAMAKGNLAWLAWRKQQYDEVEKAGQAALVLWQQLPVTHASAPFQWLALLPLITAALHDEEMERVMDDTRRLLDPHQQQLPKALHLLLEQSLDAWDRGVQSDALQFLHQAIVVAQQIHYL